MGSSETYQGKLKQYDLLETFQSNMLDLYESEKDADILFVIEGSEEKFSAHSSVVSVRCKLLRENVIQFLHEKVEGSSADAKVLEIRVRPVMTGTFLQVLLYVYTGRITLDRESLYDVCSLSEIMGIPSLQNIVFCYLEDGNNIVEVAYILDRAVCDGEQKSSLIVRLTQFFSENCATILKEVNLKVLSFSFMHHVVKQESINCSENDLWSALIFWICHSCQISPYKMVSSMSPTECCVVATRMITFCQPGYLRILNFDKHFFSKEVEPLNVFPSSEVLLKYRFDAAFAEFGFENAFPKDRYSFLTRTRQRTMFFESSSHPHPRGVHLDIKAELPQWVTELEVTFDYRTAVGKYADLEFFSDENRICRIFSLRMEQESRARSCVRPSSIVQSERKALPSLYITGHCFWFTFYAPQNVGDLAWGYKFQVSVLK